MRSSLGVNKSVRIASGSVIPSFPKWSDGNRITPRYRLETLHESVHAPAGITTCGRLTGHFGMCENWARLPLRHCLKRTFDVVEGAALRGDPESRGILAMARGSRQDRPANRRLRENRVIKNLVKPL